MIMQYTKKPTVLGRKKRQNPINVTYVNYCDAAFPSQRMCLPKGRLFSLLNALCTKHISHDCIYIFYPQNVIKSLLPFSLLIDASIWGTCTWTKYTNLYLRLSMLASYSCFLFQLYLHKAILFLIVRKLCNLLIQPTK